MRALRITVVVLASLALSGCATTRSAKDLMRLQNAGLWTQSVYYTGSTKNYHHFDVPVILGKYWWTGGLIGNGCDPYKVPRNEVHLPQYCEHSRFGLGNKSSLKMRIKPDSDLIGGYRAVLRRE